MNEELFDFYYEIIKRECEKFDIQLYFQDNPINAQTTHDIDYNKPLNRVDFLYNLALSNVVFAKYCFGIFFTTFKRLVSDLGTNFNLCTISNGPAVEYVAFLLEYGIYPSIESFHKNRPVQKLTVLSKYGAWRNSINFVNDVILEGRILNNTKPVSARYIETIQFNPLISVENLPDNVRNAVSTAKFIIIMKPIGVCSNENLAENIMKLCADIQPDTYVLCIETRPVVDLFSEILSQLGGRFLWGPYHLSIPTKIESFDMYKELYGCGPVASARGTFFIWRKEFIAPYRNDFYERFCFSDLYSSNLEVHDTESAQSLDYESDSAIITERDQNHLFDRKLLNRSAETQNSDPLEEFVQSNKQNENWLGNWRLINENAQTRKSVLVDKSIQVSMQCENCGAEPELIGKYTEIQNGDNLNDYLETAVFSADRMTSSESEIASLSLKMQRLTESISKLTQMSQACFDKMSSTENKNAMPCNVREKTSHSDCQSSSRKCLDCMPICSHSNRVLGNDSSCCNKNNVPNNMQLSNNPDTSSPKLVLDLDSLDGDTLNQIKSLLLRRKRLNLG